jgi:hypothetical protein
MLLAAAKSNPPLIKRNVRWRSRTAIIPAIYDENVTWASDQSFVFHPTNNFSLVQYQRLDAQDDFFSPNRGDEAGVFLQFIAEHYDSLPDFSVFVQGKPAYIQKIRCITLCVVLAPSKAVGASTRALGTGRESTVFA